MFIFSIIMEYYYNIKLKDKDVNRIVIRVDSGKLEILTGGEESLKEYNVNIDNNQISVGDNYIAMPISVNDARMLVEKYNDKRGGLTSMDFACLGLWVNACD